MHKLLLAATFAAALATPAAAETAADFNLFVLENFHAVGADEEGRVAVGGDFYARNHSVGLLADYGAVNLVVGGDFDAKSGSAFGKTIVGVGGAISTDSSWAPSDIQPSGTPLPVDFGAEAIRLRDLSDTLASQAATGTTQYQYCNSCQITLTGGLSGLNVFTVDADKLALTNTFNIFLPSDGFALINVKSFTGSTAASFGNAGMFLNGAALGNCTTEAASRLFWNYAEATTLDFHGIAMNGSVLAPNADYIGRGGVILGQVVVKSFGNASLDNNMTQINQARDGTGLLTPPTSAAPEPGAWALLILGFAAAGGAIRRRRAFVA